MNIFTLLRHDATVFYPFDRKSVKDKLIIFSCMLQRRNNYRLQLQINRLFFFFLLFFVMNFCSF